MKPPTKPGLYIARKSDFQWWNLVVIIEGEEPYLHYVAWDRANWGRASIEKGNKPPVSWVWGARVEFPS
jgi:hypothetical protein